MDSEKILHQGHRQRLLKKLNENPSLLADHEILEALLFFVLPRVDTNPLAHKLINLFGGLKKVLTAKKFELMTVKGVGERTADFLITAGQTFARAFVEKDKAVCFNSPEKLNAYLLEEFKFKTKESCVLILMDNKYKQVSKLYFTDFDCFEVDVDLNEVVNSLAVFKPSFAIIAHNHVWGSHLPTHSDDVATKKVALICNIHGVKLIEHAIVKGEKVYSYRAEGRLELLQRETDLNKILV